MERDKRGEMLNAEMKLATVGNLRFHLYFLFFILLFFLLFILCVLPCTFIINADTHTHTRTHTHAVHTQTHPKHTHTHTVHTHTHTRPHTADLSFLSDRDSPWGGMCLCCVPLVPRASQRSAPLNTLSRVHTLLRNSRTCSVRPVPLWDRKSN